MAHDTNQIRNAVLLGHSNSGKTSLAETMLFESKGISRRGTIEDGNTISDYKSSEKERGGSIFSSLMHVYWKDIKINLIDTPGIDDFIGEVVSSIKVADTAVMVLNAKEGIEVGNEVLGEYVLEEKTPMIFVVNHMDHPNADFEKTLNQTKERFGNQVLEFQFPYKKESGFNHIVDALRMTMYTFDETGGKPTKSDIPAEVLDRAKALHNRIVESAAEHEDGLMEAYFEKGSLSEEELTEGLKLAIGKQSLFPVFCVSAIENKGSGRVMGFIRDICPSPKHQAAKPLVGGEFLECNKGLETTIFIYKTLTEPQVGDVSYFKVYAGELNAGDELINANTGETERMNQLYVINGKIKESVNKLVAGDLGAALKMHHSHTGNTLNQKGTERKIMPMVFPPSRMRLAVKPPAKQDIDKLTKALHTIQEEDPTIIVEHNKELKQIILHGQGQLHFEVTAAHIEHLYGTKIEFERAKIPYRETISASSDAQYRHKKQSGGSGQFAEVHLRMEPYVHGMEYPSDLTVRKDDLIDLPWGGKLSILWCIVGGTIDTKYYNAVKKGIMNVMESGPQLGVHCQDIRVAIYDGKMHSVDSNDMAFQLATSAAIKEAFLQAKPVILEPLYHLEVMCDNEVLGDIMSDLQSRRAMILGIEAERHYQKVSASVPVKDLYGYSSALRSMTQGKAKFMRRLEGYQGMNHEDQKILLAAKNKEE